MEERHCSTRCWVLSRCCLNSWGMVYLESISSPLMQAAEGLHFQLPKFQQRRSHLFTVAPFLHPLQLRVLLGIIVSQRLGYWKVILLISLILVRSCSFVFFCDIHIMEHVCFGISSSNCICSQSWNMRSVIIIMLTSSFVAT